jgi:flagellar biosynthetic protein FliS
MIGTQSALNSSTGYLAAAVGGAEPQELMKLGLDRACNLLLQAEEAVAAGDRTVKIEALNSAFAIVEFLLGLSGSERGPLSGRLAQVYQYAMVAVLRGNADDDAASIAAARIALEDLSALWRQMFPDLLASAE